MALLQLACLISVLIIGINANSFPVLGNFGRLGTYVDNLRGKTDVSSYLGGMHHQADNGQNNDEQADDGQDDQGGYDDDFRQDTEVGPYASDLHEQTDTGEYESGEDGVNQDTDIGHVMSDLHGQTGLGGLQHEISDLHGQTDASKYMDGLHHADVGKYLSDVHRQANAGKYLGGLQKEISDLRGQSDASKYASGVHHADVSKYISELRGQTSPGKYLGGSPGQTDVGKYIGVLRGATPLGKYISSSSIKPSDMPVQGSAILSGEHVHGRLSFFQATSTSPVVISGEIHGLSPGNHGMHVHESGDMSRGCESNGDHFNPYNKNHGGQKDAERHLGDLGNIKADAHGVAKVFKIDSLISLKGPHSIVGRSMIVHENPDDLGKGGDAESKESGNSGGRLACGVILLQH